MPVGLDTVLGVSQARAQGTKPPLTPDQLSSYIAVNADGTVDAYFGKTDMAQGLFTAIGQIVAEELDVPYKAVKVIMGQTRNSVNQGGASGSTGIQFGGKQMRYASAEARRVLVDMAAEKLNLPADQLTVTDGVVHAKSDPNKKVSYAELIGGQYFNTQLEWNKQIGNALYAPGKAQPKSYKEHKIVGKPIPRDDVAPVVFGTEVFVTRRAGAQHGARPHDPSAGRGRGAGEVRRSPRSRASRACAWCAKAIRSSASSPTPNGARSRRAQQLKIEWSDVKPPFPDNANAIYDHIRKAPVRGKGVDGKPVGNVDEAFKTAARVIEHEYEWPFQSHASMGPGCGVVDARPDRATVWTGSPEAALLPRRRRRHPRPQAGPGRRHLAAGGRRLRPQRRRRLPASTPPCCRRRSAVRCACNTRARKAPAGIRKARPRSIACTRGLDSSGNVIAYEFYTKAFSRWDVQTNESRPERTLAGHFLGAPLKSEDGFGGPAETYTFANKQARWETIHPLLERASPLRTSHLRDPVGPQIQFASESFWDEVAHALGVDPVEFRLKYVKDPRDAAVLRAAAEKHGWKPRPSPDKTQTGNTVTGRGIAYARAQRHRRRDRRGGRRRPPQRQDLGAQVHRRARLRPDHQSGRAEAHRSTATSSRASAARSGKRCSSTTRR